MSVKIFCNYSALHLLAAASVGLVVQLVNS